MKKTFAFAFKVILVFVLCTTLQAQAGSVLLEQGSYAEETLGDLDKAIGIYEKIVGDTQVGRDDAVEALFRLAQCQLKKGNRLEAGTMLNMLVSNYSGQSGFMGKARELLAKLQNRTTPEAISSVSNPVFFAKASKDAPPPKDAADSNRAVKTRIPFPNLKSANWPHGQTKEWIVSSKSSPYLEPHSFSAYESINEALINGKKYWCFEMLISSLPFYHRVFVEQKTFNPVLAYAKSRLFTARIAYGEKEIDLTWNAQGLEGSQIFPVNGFVSDAIQTNFLKELLPWSAGFEVTISEFSRSNYFTVQELRMKVTARETVTVPAGAFDCYKIMTEIKNEDILLDTREIWISVEKNIAIMTDFGSGYTAELVETTIDPKTISNFQESALESRYK